MSVMDKFLNAMKLNGEDDGYYDDDSYYEGDDAEETPSREPVIGKNETSMEIPEERFRKPMVKSLPGNKSVRKAVAGAASNMEICAIRPTSMEDTKEVTDTLLENRAVVLNLEGIDVDIAQRIVDFVSGSCYAIRGNLQKISRYIFIITPSSVDISGDFQEMIGGTLGDSAGK